MTIPDRTFHRAVTRGRHQYDVPRCANPRCREALAPFVWLKVCPSCRVAGRYGAALAGLAAGLVKLAIVLWPHL